MQPEWIWAQQLRYGLKERPFGETVSKSIGCVYVLYDFDDEPLYVGKSTSAGETVGRRIERHLLGRRADAVSKGVFPPFEVRTIEVFFARRPAGKPGPLTQSEKSAIARRPGEAHL